MLSFRDCHPAGAPPEADRTPRFTNIHVEPGGAIEFTALSPAFRGGGTVRVRSSDAGASWQVDSP